MGCGPAASTIVEYKKQLVWYHTQFMMSPLSGHDLCYVREEVMFQRLKDEETTAPPLRAKRNH